MGPMNGAFILLMATAILHLAAANKCPEKSEFSQEYVDCKKKVAGENWDKIDDITMFMEHGSCIIMCMLSQFKILKEDGTINREEAASMAKDCKEKHTDWADKIDRVDSCFDKHANEVDPSKKEHCAGYHTLVDCLVHEFRKH